MEDFFAGVQARWPAGREHLHWHILPDPDMFAWLARPYTDLTHSRGLAPVKPRWSHITIAHLVAPADKISGGQVTEMTRQVREHCARLPPFAVTVDRAQVWPAGIVCPVRPGKPLRRLHKITAGAATAAGGGVRVLPEVYAPHMSLAYSTGKAPNGPARAWLADCNSSGACLPVTALSLVRQKHDGRQITWRLVEQITLGGRAAATIQERRPGRYELKTR